MMELILGGIEVVAKVIGLASDTVWRRVRVREIKNRNDRHIDDTLDLYEKLFKEEHRIAPSELVAWLQGEHGGDSGSEPLQQRLLIATRKGAVVGMLKLLYCAKCRYVFISYFGVDKTADTAARKVASKMIVRFLARYVSSKWKKCRAILFEIEIPHSRMTKVEKEECKARLRLFRDVVRRQGRTVFELKVDYRQPLMADAMSYSGTGRAMSLMFMPIGFDAVESIPRDDAEQMLRFLLLRVYSTAQTIAPKKRVAYKKYLVRLYESTIALLAERVDVE
jgi:hypothetical protein